MNPLMCPGRARLDDLPPTHFTIAACDILAEQNLILVEKMRGAGVDVESCVYEGASHSFLEAMSLSSLSLRAIDDTCEWLAECLG
jgi:acetyl esterase